eukprot:c53967_g1_i1 orf=296-460(+)
MTTWQSVPYLSCLSFHMSLMNKRTEENHFVYARCALAMRTGRLLLRLLQALKAA